MLVHKVSSLETGLGKHIFIGEMNSAFVSQGSGRTVLKSSFWCLFVSYFQAILSQRNHLPSHSTQGCLSLAVSWAQRGGQHPLGMLILAQRKCWSREPLLFRTNIYSCNLHIYSTQLESAQLSGATKLPFPKVYLPLKGYAYS